MESSNPLPTSGWGGVGLLLMTCLFLVACSGGGAIEAEGLGFGTSEPASASTPTWQHSRNPNRFMQQLDELRMSWPRLNSKLNGSVL